MTHCGHRAQVMPSPKADASPSSVKSRWPREVGVVYISGLPRRARGSSRQFSEMGEAASASTHDPFDRESTQLAAANDSHTTALRDRFPASEASAPSCVRRSPTRTWRPSYLLPEITEADHGRRGLPSGDVLRARSSTVASIFLQVGSSAFARPATTGAAISVIKRQYSSAVLKVISPATVFTVMSFRPPLRKAVSI